ncbi:MAG: ATP-binding cassette domain-containing protein, partial [Alphaproteobacteria bacterium]|nr:ATP-binding cassette domain-containing protein [Alphaproteobacteria bacterium]
MISLRDLGHTYVTDAGARIEALRGVTLDIAANSFVAIVGASGCGKSTMLRLLAGLERPTSGSLKIGGEEVTAPRQDIGIAFQAPTLLPWANVLKNVLFPMRLMRRLGPDAEKRARDLLTLAGLDGFADKMPHELSGGMQQRVAICRALVHD